MIYSVVLVSGVQQSDIIMHSHISILFQILFPQSTESIFLIFKIVFKSTYTTVLERGLNEVMNSKVPSTEPST